MQKFDTHVHSNHSHDGKFGIDELARLASSHGVDGFCITDHLDLDLEWGECKSAFVWKKLRLEDYYQSYLNAKEEVEQCKNGSLNLLFGVEAGFSEKGCASEKYGEVIASYPFDEVINSTHCVLGREAFFADYFYFKSKRKAYGDYLDAVLKSLDAPYPYDVGAHIGYITHGAPYKDKSLVYEDFPDKFDAILKGIIELGKTLEVNFHHAVAPHKSVLERYFELGGRAISYGGDSHRGEIGERFDDFVALVKPIGFEGYNYFVRHAPVFVPFDKD